jgi:hypothetical protein
MKHSAEYDAFTNLVDRVLAVPHAVIKQRVEEERKRIAADPDRPGPKSKRKRKTTKSSA